MRAGEQGALKHGNARPRLAHIAAKGIFLRGFPLKLCTTLMTKISPAWLPSAMVCWLFGEFSPAARRSDGQERYRHRNQNHRLSLRLVMTISVSAPVSVRALRTARLTEEPISVWQGGVSRETRHDLAECCSKIAGLHVHQIIKHRAAQIALNRSSARHQINVMAPMAMAMPITNMKPMALYSLRFRTGKALIDQDLHAVTQRQLCAGGEY